MRYVNYELKESLGGRYIYNLNYKEIKIKITNKIKKHKGRASVNKVLKIYFQSHPQYFKILFCIKNCFIFFALIRI